MKVQRLIDHPTAVAVVSDILAIARAKQAGINYYAALPVENSPTVTVDFATKHYLRFMVRDRPGIIASLATILS
jgi:homoserine dehydrogenase